MYCAWPKNSSLFVFLEFLCKVMSMYCKRCKFGLLCSTKECGHVFHWFFNVVSLVFVVFCCREPHYTILPCTVKLMLQSILWSREHMSTAKMKTMYVLWIVQGQPRNASFNCLVVVKIVVVSKFHPGVS